MKKTKSKDPIEFKLALIPIGIAINIVIGTIAHWLKLPIYLDAIGTILITFIIGWKYGAITGVLSFLLAGILTNPILPFFSLTQIAIAIYIYYFIKKGAFKNIWTTLIIGIGLGIVAGLVSAPVIAYLFGGITGSGRSLITAYLIKSGENLLNSVALSGFASEPLDKTIQIFIAIGIIKSVPKPLLYKISQKELFKNLFLINNEDDTSN